jgi:hypothetical protein
MRRGVEEIRSAYVCYPRVPDGVWCVAADQWKQQLWRGPSEMLLKSTVKFYTNIRQWIYFRHLNFSINPTIKISIYLLIVACLELKYAQTSRDAHVSVSCFGTTDISTYLSFTVSHSCGSAHPPPPFTFTHHSQSYNNLKIFTRRLEEGLQPASRMRPSQCFCATPKQILNCERKKFN